MQIRHFWVYKYEDGTYAYDAGWRDMFGVPLIKNAIQFNSIPNDARFQTGIWVLIKETIEECMLPYNKDFGDNKECICGHAYYRHFDTYDNMEPIGCKYCDCYEFKEKK